MSVAFCVELLSSAALTAARSGTWLALKRNKLDDSQLKEEDAGNTAENGNSRNGQVDNATVCFFLLSIR